MTAATEIRTDWYAHGACLGIHPDHFHPDRGESTHEAKAICSTCPVRVECLDWALTTHQKFGIWGGTSERERRRIRRRLDRCQPVPELTPDWVPATRRRKPMDLAIASTGPVPTSTNGTATPAPEKELVGKPTDPDTGQPTDVCVNCGKRYTPNRSTQRFHSKECARAWYAAHPKGENGTRQPRVRQPPAEAKKAATMPAPVAVPTTTTAAGPEFDVQAFLGQLLAACDRWTIEADLGDIRVSVTRGCR